MTINFNETLEVPNEAIDYLIEVQDKFKGELNRCFSRYDYLTNPQENTSFRIGYDFCYENKLLIRTDNGMPDTCIRYKISERGYQLLKQIKQD